MKIINHFFSIRLGVLFVIALLVFSQKSLSQTVVKVVSGPSTRPIAFAICTQKKTAKTTLTDISGFAKINFTGQSINIIVEAPFHNSEEFQFVPSASGDTINLNLTNPNNKFKLILYEKKNELK